MAQNAFEHRTGGAFAVGACHGKYRAGKAHACAVVHAAGYAAQALQTQLDALHALGVKLLAIGQPLIQRLG